MDERFAEWDAQFYAETGKSVHALLYPEAYEQQARLAAAMQNMAAQNPYVLSLAQQAQAAQGSTLYGSGLGGALGGFGGLFGWR